MKKFKKGDLVWILATLEGLCDVKCGIVMSKMLFFPIYKIAVPDKNAWFYKFCDPTHLIPSTVMFKTKNELLDFCRENSLRTTEQVN